MSLDPQQPEWQGVYNSGEFASSLKALHGVLFWSGMICGKMWEFEIDTNSLANGHLISTCIPRRLED